MDYMKPIEALRAVPKTELRKIHQKTGVPLQTLRQIKYGRPNQHGEMRDTDPRIGTVIKLAAYFEAANGKAKA